MLAFNIKIHFFNINSEIHNLFIQTILEYLKVIVTKLFRK